MAYSSACFSTADVIETNMQQVEDNFDALRNHFANSTAPTSPDAGQFWYDTGASSIKIRYNSSWVEWWDMDGQCVAAGKVKTDSLAAGLLSTDSTGRSKMANGFIKSSHVEDVDASKITSLNKSQILMNHPRTFYEDRSDTATRYSCPMNSPGLTATLGKVYIPAGGAYKLKCSGMLDNAGGLTVTVGTSALLMFTAASTALVDSATYIDVTAFAGTLQTVSVGTTGTGSLVSICLYLTT